MINKITEQTSYNPEVKRINESASAQSTTIDTTNGIFCTSCGSQISFENILGEQNRKFIMNKCKERKLDDAITVARIVNQELPHLTISSENKALAATLAEVLGTKLETSVNTLTNLTSMLSQLLERVPEGIRTELATVLSKLDAMDLTTSKSSESILQTFGELINKPTSRGKAGEKTLSQAWSMTYPEDDIDDKGGPGQTDFVVTTPLKNKQMGKLSVERKSGNQKYNSKHVKEAIKHARDEGARYAVVVYDSFENNMPIHTDLFS